MSRALTNVSTSSDTFYSWIGKTNTLLELAGNTVTLASNTAGDITTGNGFVVGIFGSNTITATNIRGGNVTSNAAVNVTSNVNFGNASVNVTTTRNAIEQVKVSTLTTTTSVLQNLDTFAVADYRAGKYLISIKNTDNSDYQVTEIMVLHNGTSTYTTEYATLTSNSTLAQFTSDISGGNVRLRITPTLANNVINYQRTLLAV